MEKYLIDLANKEITMKTKSFIFLLIISFMYSRIAFAQNNNESNFKKNPYLLFNEDNTSMRIIWQLRNSENAIINLYSKDKTILVSDTIVQQTKDHLFVYDFKDLQLSTEYNYEVVSNTEVFKGSFYSRIPESATNFSFIAYGDTRTNPLHHDSVCEQMLLQVDKNPQLKTFIVSTGDLISNGDKEKLWQEQFFDAKYTNITKVLASFPYMVSMGNHEGQGKLFAKYFQNQLYQNNRYYYSFIYGNAHFIALDQFTKLKKGSEQYNWLENELSKSTSEWKIILLHKPGYTAGGHGDNKTVKKVLQPLFEKYNVQLVLAGHNHYYARANVNDVTHITTGGGGAPLYSPKQKDYIIKIDESNHFLIISILDKKMIIKAIRADGSIIENYTITNN